MDLKSFKSGLFQEGYEYKYFLPEKINHTYFWTDDTINELLETASFKIGELNSFSRFVPDVDMFMRMHILKEAVVSSRIEGTRTGVEEALLNENDIEAEKRDDWGEVNNYINAMNYAIDKLQELPLSNRLLKETHRILLQSVRGEHKKPGEFRNSQNWIGGASLKDAKFIPPVHNEVPDLMSDLEKFIHNKSISVPHLIRIAIVHYQFETIHPFLDGNGRIGRLLITLYLVSMKIMDKPLLYLSEFFENNKGLYYDNLSLVREKNDLIQWVKYFLVGVSKTSDKAILTLKKIVEIKHLYEEEKLLILKRRYEKGKILFQKLFSKPLVGMNDVQQITGLSPRTASNLVDWFIGNGILHEITGMQRNRIFIFDEYVKLFK